jgi:hypothetical protein
VCTVKLRSFNDRVTFADAIFRSVVCWAISNQLRSIDCNVSWAQSQRLNLLSDRHSVWQTCHLESSSVIGGSKQTQCLACDFWSLQDLSAPCVGVWMNDIIIFGNVSWHPERHVFPHWSFSVHKYGLLCYISLLAWCRAWYRQLITCTWDRHLIDWLSKRYSIESGQNQQMRPWHVPQDLQDGGGCQFINTCIIGESHGWLYVNIGIKPVLITISPLKTYLCSSKLVFVVGALVYFPVLRFFIFGTGTFRA